VDGLSIVALVLGVTGVIVGGLAWRQARAATAQAAASRLAQEGIRSVADAGPSAKDATAARNARGQPRPPVSHDAVASAPAAPRAEGAATLVVRAGSTPGQDLPTNQGSGSGLLGLFLVNDGPAVAHDLRLSAHFPNGTVRTSAIQQALSAHKEVTLFAQVVPEDFGSTTRVEVLYRVAYRDGNGAHDLVQRVHVEGGWAGPWKTFLEEDGRDARGLPR
jgi:hypothetical protein